MQKNIKYWIWLSILSNKIKVTTIHQLLKEYKEPNVIWNLTKEELLKNYISKEEILEILKLEYKQNLESYLYYMKQKDIKIICYNDKNYPKKLKNIYDPPIVIYAKGDINILHENAVGIVGCRLCSAKGRNQAQEFAYNIAKNNIVVISGLARGIDTWAHIGCIRANGKTIAVLGSGLDIIYPPENEVIFEKITQTGLAISEYIVGTEPISTNFPKRNRIISGLSNGVLIVEAKQKSGSLITADLALEEGKEVYAIPGNIYDANSKGTNELIKQGAKIVTTIEDIIQDF